MRVLWLQRKVNVVGVGVGVNRGMAEGKKAFGQVVGKKVMSTRVNFFSGVWSGACPRTSMYLTYDTLLYQLTVLLCTVSTV